VRALDGCPPWPVQAPFIVTQCGHAFCMEHKDDQKFKDSTCPGCQSHLSSKGGIRKVNVYTSHLCQRPASDAHLPI